MVKLYCTHIHRAYKTSSIINADDAERDLDPPGDDDSSHECHSRGGLTSRLFVNNKFETGSTRMGSRSAGKKDINICLVHSVMSSCRTRLPRTVRNIFKTVSQ